MASPPLHEDYKNLWHIAFVEQGSGRREQKRRLVGLTGGEEQLVTTIRLGIYWIIWPISHATPRNILESDYICGRLHRGEHEKQTFFPRNGVSRSGE